MLFTRLSHMFGTAKHTVRRSLRGANRSLASEKGKVPETYAARIISWYPGHIAKAERELNDYLKKVDVVIEVRDARIPISTTHPLVPRWVGNKPLVVAIARLDQVSKAALDDWKEYYSKHPAYPERPESKVFFLNSKDGVGVQQLKAEALKASEKLNAKRMANGILPRAVRAAVIGFPNVGKSTLINRLLGKTLAKAKNMPGVTRHLQWIRIGGTASGSQENCIELLDSPGIIPARALDQRVAVQLAICNDIGQASYDRELVAAAMIDAINALHKKAPAYVNMVKMVSRFGFPVNDLNGREAVQRLADLHHQGHVTAAAEKMLSDFRNGKYGYSSLECVSDAPAAKAKETGISVGDIEVPVADERAI